MMLGVLLFNDRETLLSTRISTKTSATGAVGAVSGVGLAPLIIWALAQFGIEMDAATAAVAGGLITTVATTLIAWLMPAKQGKHVDTEPWVLEPAEDELSSMEIIDEELPVCADCDVDDSKSSGEEVIA